MSDNFCRSYNLFDTKSESKIKQQNKHKSANKQWHL